MQVAMFHLSHTNVPLYIVSLPPFPAQVRQISQPLSHRPNFPAIPQVARDTCASPCTPLVRMRNDDLAERGSPGSAILPKDLCMGLDSLRGEFQTCDRVKILPAV